MQYAAALRCEHGVCLVNTSSTSITAAYFTIRLLIFLAQLHSYKAANIFATSRM